MMSPMYSVSGEYLQNVLRAISFYEAIADELFWHLEEMAKNKMLTSDELVEAKQFIDQHKRTFIHPLEEKTKFMLRSTANA